MRRLLIILYFCFLGTRATRASCGDLTCGNVTDVVRQRTLYASPCYPDSYGDNENCSHTLRLSETNYSQISLRSLDIVSWFDYVKLDGPEKFLIFVDSATNRAIITGYPGENIVARFVSENNTNSAGFNANVTGISENELLDQFVQYRNASAVQLLNSPLYLSDSLDKNGIIFINVPSTAKSLVEAWPIYAASLSPANVSISRADVTTLQVNWTSINGAIGYRVVVSPDNITKRGNPPMLFYNLNFKHEYHVSVVAIFKVGKSNPSSYTYRPDFCRNVVCGENAYCNSTDKNAKCKCCLGYKGDPTVGCLAFCEKENLMGVNGTSYSFSSVFAHVTAYSEKKCGNGFPRASIVCEKTAGSQKAEFSRKTMFEIDCSLKIKTVADEIKENASVRELETFAGQLQLLTMVPSLTTEDTQHVVNSVEKASKNNQKAITALVMQRLVNTVDNLIASNSLEPPQQQTATTPNTTGRPAPPGRKKQKKTKRRLLKSLTDLTQQATIPENSSEVNIKTPSMVVKVMDHPKNDTSKTVTTFAPVIPNNFSTAAGNASTFQPVRINVTTAAIEKASAGGNQTRVSFVTYDDATLFPTNYTGKTPQRIVSVIVGTNKPIKGLKREEAVVYSYADVTPKPGERKTSNERVKKKITMQCRFWDVNNGEWSTDGCCAESRTSCRCDHMTNYAVLMVTDYVPENVALDTISDVGVVLSLVCLALTVSVHCLKEEVRTRRPTMLLINICCNLFIANVIFVVGVTKTEHEAGCTVITAAMHYFFLTSWTWMTMYAYDMYRSLVVIFNKSKSHYLTKCALFAYGVPLLITALNVAIAVGYVDANAVPPNVCVDKENYLKELQKNSTLSSAYRADNMCWIHRYSLYFGFLAPVGLMLLFNLLVYGMVIRTVARRHENVQSTAKETSARDRIMISITLIASTGLTWGVGYLMLLSPNKHFLLVMSWIFTILNGLQGVAIFLTTCVRYENMRKIWLDPLRNWFRCSCKCMDSFAKKELIPSESAQTTYVTTIHDNPSKDVATLHSNSKKNISHTAL